MGSTDVSLGLFRVSRMTRLFCLKPQVPLVLPILSVLSQDLSVLVRLFLEIFNVSSRERRPDCSRRRKYLTLGCFDLLVDDKSFLLKTP